MCVSGTLVSAESEGNALYPMLSLVGVAVVVVVVALAVVLVLVVVVVAGRAGVEFI